MVEVTGALRVQSAFFDAFRSGSAFRRRGRAVAEPLRGAEVPAEWAGFWAITELSAVERTVKPESVSSD